MTNQFAVITTVIFRLDMKHDLYKSINPPNINLYVWGLLDLVEPSYIGL